MAKLDDVMMEANKMGELLEQHTDQHLIRMRKSIRRLQQRITNDLKATLSTTSKGILVGPRVNLKQAQKVHQRLLNAFDEEFGEVQRRGLTKSFDAIAGQIQDSFRALDVAADFTSVDRDMIDLLKNQALEEFETYGAGAVDQMATAMYDTVVARGSFAELVGVMDGILIGGFDKRGQSMAQYSSLWANDAIMNYQQQVHLKKGRDAGLSYFLYFGNVMEQSRPFCIDRAGKRYSQKQIESWNNMSWQGKSGPPLTNRGGWNCRHHWQPIKKEWIPEEGLDVGDYFDEAGIPIARGTTVPDWPGPKAKKPKPKKKKPLPKKKTTATGAGRWVPPDSFHPEANEWRNALYKSGQDYHNWSGLNPSGPIADNIVDVLQREGRNGRVMMTTFRNVLETGADQDKMFTHFVAVELDDAGKVIRIFDPANQYRYRLGLAGMEDIAPGAKLPEYWPTLADELDAKRMAPQIFGKGKWARDTSTLYSMDDHKYFYDKMADPAVARAAAKEAADVAAKKAKVAGGEYKAFKTLDEAEAWAQAHGAPVLPKTQSEAFREYQRWYDKRFPNMVDDPLRLKHLDQWYDNMEGIDDITDAAFLRMQNAINSNYANPLYLQEAGLGPAGGEDIIIMLKKQVAKTTEAGRSLGDVTMIWDKGMRRSPPKSLIPGENLSWRQAVLRHERGHEVWAQMNAKQTGGWWDVFDSMDRPYWRKELTQYAGTNAEEMFCELFATVTDPKFIDDWWRYDAAIKQLVTKEFPEVAKAAKAAAAGELYVPGEKTAKVGFKAWKPAKTKAEAKRIMQDIIEECNRRATHTTIKWGDEAGEYYVRYWHAEQYSRMDHRLKPHSWRAAKIHNMVKVSAKSSLSELNAINRKLALLQEQTALMEIPPLRGAFTWAKKADWGANMGDGVMGLHHDSFGYYFGKLEFDKAKYVANVENAMEGQRKLLKTVATLEGKNSGAYKAVQEQIKLRERELKRLAEETWEGPMYGTAKSKPTTWKPGDDITSRPSSSADYFGDFKNKGDSLMDHEFGHHIHQQLFVDGDPDMLADPPLERWIKYYYEQNPNTATKIQKNVPSTYSLKKNTHGKEWFAESYSCWRGGAKHVVPEELAGMFELFDDFEAGKITSNQLKLRLFDGGDFARPIIPPVKGVYKEAAEIAGNTDDVFFKTMHILKQAEAEGRALTSYDVVKEIKEEFNETLFSWDVDKAMTKALNKEIVQQSHGGWLYTGPGKKLRDEVIKPAMKYKLPDVMQASKVNIKIWDRVMQYSAFLNEPVGVNTLVQELGTELYVIRTFLKEMHALGVMDRMSVKGFTKYFIKNADSYIKGG